MERRLEAALIEELIRQQKVLYARHLLNSDAMNPYTWRQIAQRTGISEVAMSNYRRHKNYPCALICWIKLCSALKLDFLTLLRQVQEGRILDHTA